MASLTRNVKSAETSRMELEWAEAVAHWQRFLNRAM